MSHYFGDKCNPPHGSLDPADIEPSDVVRASVESVPTYDASEQDVILDVFKDMLATVTKDGGHKRAAGTKPPWFRDQTHEAAIFSHINKWKHGEYLDPDSGAHTLIHLAWRALAIAYQETYGKRDPRETPEWFS